MRTIQKQELGMCKKSRKYMRIIQKSKLSMCNMLENTCLKAKNNDPACMITGKTHAQQAKTENRYVNCFRKHMYKI